MKNQTHPRRNVFGSSQKIVMKNTARISHMEFVTLPLLLQERDENLRFLSCWVEKSSRRKWLQAGAPAVVLVAVMMHVETRKASQHILKTAPPYILFSITGQALILISWCRQARRRRRRRRLGRT
jgi:hypothetical protein